ncbi:MAG: hypothetical protein ACKN9V_07730 [Pseudomonadota bacterium]
MTGFFGFASILSACLLGATIILGYLGHPSHLLVSLVAAFVAISAHCLIFGIFTGAGKDTRELVQDLHLNPEFIGQTKSFRKITFPPALYAILMILVTAFLGGALSTARGTYWSTLHGLLAWLTFAYNLKTFLLEYRCVRENAAILKRVNLEAAKVTVEHPELAAIENFESPEIVDGLGGYQWGSHVFALGKFLCFLGWNAFLPFIYMRFIMGMILLPVWPFLVFSIVFLSGGFFLRWKYRQYQPGKGATPQTPVNG